MSANIFGSRFQILSFGESHGPGLGVVIDGCPAGLSFDEKLLQKNLERRRPGSSATVSARNEGDHVEILSGVFNGKTLGTPLAMLVRNQDARSEDYAGIAHSPRPGHADDVWQEKFRHVDHRGGGRSSGRETVARVMAGSVAQMLVQALSPATRVHGYAQSIGPFSLAADEALTAQNLNTEAIDKFTARFPSPQQSEKVRELLLRAKDEGKSYGGQAQLWVQAPPKSLGQPVFHKFKADLAQAMMSVGATASFELGEGRASSTAEGSEFHRQGESPYGGLRGGISTGESMSFSVSFKPTASVLDVAKKGRHDPCIVPRALPVLEAMTYLVLADHLLWARQDRLGV